MIKYLKYLPLALFFLYSLKLLVKGVDYTDAPILFILASAAAVYEFKSQDKKVTELEEKFKEIEQIAKEAKKYSEDAKNYVSAAKLSNQVRTPNGINR